jgi:hypothetical protein
MNCGHAGMIGGLLQNVIAKKSPSARWLGT